VRFRIIRADNFYLNPYGGFTAHVRQAASFSPASVPGVLRVLHQHKISAFAVRIEVPQAKSLLWRVVGKRIETRHRSID
jgi:hypothetical protein